MTEPPPRKRFQIHLSTAIVMMFFAGGFLYLNLRQRIGLREETKKYPDGWMKYTYEKKLVCGWPLNFCDDLLVSGQSNIETAEEFASQRAELIQNDNSVRLFSRSMLEWHYANLATDIACSMAALVAFCCFCEWLIRRRAARKSG